MRRKTHTPKNKRNPRGMLWLTLGQENLRRLCEVAESEKRTAKAQAEIIINESLKANELIQQN